MPILIIGATGTVGRAISKDLETGHDVILAGRNGPDVKLDMTDSASLLQTFQNIGEIDAMVVCAGHVPFRPFGELADQDFRDGIENKLLGQVNLVRASLSTLKPGGAIVLTSGILADEPLIGSTCAAAVNGALNAFVMALAAEQARRLRINIVSPGIVEESIATHGDYFVGFEPTSMSRLVAAYRRCLFGPISGRVIRV